MNQIETIIKWYAEGDISMEQLTKFLQDLNVMPKSIVTVQKRAELKRSRYLHRKHNAPQEEEKKDI